MKILVTGCCGFIGSNFALKAMEQNHEIIAFDNLSRLGTEYNLAELRKNDHFFLIRGDIRCREDFDKIPKVDAVIHLAAQSGVPWSMRLPRFDFEINARGTLNVLEFARDRGNIPLVYSSTNKVYSEQVNDLPRIEKETRFEWKIDKGIREDFPVDSAGKYPRSPYGCSKYMGDTYCTEYYHMYGVPTVVNRMSCIAGEWQQGCEDQGWMAWFVMVKMFDAYLTIYGNGKQVRDVLYVGELADLYLEQLQNIDTYKGTVYNIGGGPENTVSLIEVMEHLVALDGRNFKLLYKDWRPADHFIYISDLSKIKEHWRPKINPIETVDHIWNWAQAHRRTVWEVFRQSLAYQVST